MQSRPAAVLVGPARKQLLRHHRAGLVPTLLAGMQAAVRGGVRPCPPIGGGEILTFSKQSPSLFAPKVTQWKTV